MYCVFTMCLLHIYLCRYICHEISSSKVHFYPHTPLPVIFTKKIQNCVYFIINDIMHLFIKFNSYLLFLSGVFGPVVIFTLGDCCFTFVVEVATASRPLTTL